MTVERRIEQALHAALDQADQPDAPPRLMQAMRHAVFPGGARVRPRLCLAVALACGDDRPPVSAAAAVAIELLHCASLVHDDLPCFDDAALRRGKPSVHRAFGEPLAVLAGDAMIVLAFESLARVAASAPERVASLLLTVSRSVGAPSGIVAGQAWESEDSANLSHYQQAKTGSLFVAATMAGAAAAGHEPEPWSMLGERIGEAYQVADDVRDVLLSTKELGKPAGQDDAHNRPNAVAALGLPGAIRHLEQLITDAVYAIPACPGQAALRALVLQEVKRLLPPVRPSAGVDA